jgi:alkylhydroperoxidase family enzyme
LDIGAAVSSQLGISREKVQAILDYEHSVLFTQREVTVLRYADAMTRNPVEIPNAVFHVLKTIYGDMQIVELTSAIAWEHYRARFNHALGIEAEGFSEASFCLLPPRTSESEASQ